MAISFADKNNHKKHTLYGTMWNHIIIFCALWSHLSSFGSLSSTNEDEEELKGHKRTKRFLWMTHEKRLVLPVLICPHFRENVANQIFVLLQPGTQLVLTPTLAMPFLRYPPTGLDANLTISTPFTRELPLIPFHQQLCHKMINYD